jgi:hypothetical protein
MSYVERLTRPQLLALARSLAPFLPGFVPDENPDDTHEYAAKMLHADGRSLFFASKWGGKPGQVCVSGDFPYEWHQFREYKEGNYSINVSTSRTPESIAGDITRRLLPNYTPAFERRRERVAEHDAYVAKRDGNAERVARAFLSADGKSKDTEGRVWLNGLGEAQVSADSVTLRISVPVDVAVAIGRLVTDAKK